MEASGKVIEHILQCANQKYRQEFKKCVCAQKYLSGAKSNGIKRNKMYQ